MRRLHPFQLLIVMVLSLSMASATALRSAAENDAPPSAATPSASTVEASGGATIDPPDPGAEEPSLADSQEPETVEGEGAAPAEPASEADGTILVVVTDQQTNPVVGAGVTLFAVSSGACDSAVIADEQLTDANGATVFVGLDPAASYCVTQTTVPAAYDPPAVDSVIVTPADEADGPLDATALFVNALDPPSDPPPAGTLRLLTYVCSVSEPPLQRVTIDVLSTEVGVESAATEACVATATTSWLLIDGSEEQIEELTTNDEGSAIYEGFPVGQHLFRTVEPVGSDTIAVNILENGVATIVVRIFDFESAFAIDKVDHRGLTVGGAGFTFFDSTCTTALTDEHLNGDGGRLVVEDLPFGTYCLVETTVPPGYDGSEPQIVAVSPDGPNQATVVNQPKRLGTVKVIKWDQHWQPVPGAGFTIYAGSCAEDDALGGPLGDELTTDANGVVVFYPLDPTAAYCVKETTVPNGYLPDGSDRQNVVWAAGAGVGTVDALLWFFNTRADGGEGVEPGTLIVLKYFCPVADAADERTTFRQVNQGWFLAAADETSDLAACTAGPADFELTLAGAEEPTIVSTDASGRLVLHDVPDGSLLREISPRVSEPREIGSHPAYAIMWLVQNLQVPPAPPTGTLEVIKEVCERGDDDVTFAVSAPDAAPTSETVDETCDRGAADFAVYPFGDRSVNPIALSTGADGVVTIELPVSTDPHLLVEVDSGASTDFAIAEGKKTTIVVVNEVGAPPADDDDDETPTKLPTTGVGGASGAPGWLALAGALAIGCLLAARARVGRLTRRSAALARRAGGE